MKIIIAALMLLASLTAAIAFGLGGDGSGDFGHMGALPTPTATAAPSCPSPTAPNGQVDLSQCSNAFYAVVILY